MTRFRKRLPVAGPTVEMQILNPATNTASVQLSTVAELKMTLTNNTGVDIAIEAGQNAAVMQIFMPDAYFSYDQIEAMSIELDDWTFTYVDALNALGLTYSGANRSWAQGTAIEFTIHNVLSTGDAGIGDVLINPTNIEGPNVPPQFQATLDITQSSSGTKPKLSDVLRATLENQGIVYVSDALDPLKNTLVLNLKNTGTTPIYMSKAQWTVAPTIKARFDYGSNPGDLAPAIDPSKPPVESAWRIKGTIASKQGGSWGITGPGTDTTPAWVLSPAVTNLEVLGAGNTANITFGFEEIVSVTQAGHTQMHLECSNFLRDENTPYEQGSFPPLDILKLDAPPTRGLLSFYSRSGVLFESEGSGLGTSIDLTWKMLYVAKVNILTSYPGMEVETRLYPKAPALNTDNFTVKIPGTWNSMLVTITVQAFDAHGGYLNSQQLTVSITSNNFVDPRDGKIYPTVQVGNKWWLAHNLNFVDTNPARWNDDYDGISSNGERYGRLYSGTAATASVPPGWRLPSQEDWESLFDSLASAPYEGLMDGGASGFKAQLGGAFRSDPFHKSGKFVQLDEKGYYWTSTPNGNQLCYALFDSTDKTVAVNYSTLLDDGCSIRYVKDI
jgi:uncharacterized protein (TIGR02145 family)